MAQQETVRAVELGAFGIRDRSIDRWRLVDNHRPFPQDICARSSLWWDEVLNVAGALYRVWLNSEPMERLRLVPITPPAFQRPPRLRIEQRGSVALLRAMIPD